MSTTRLVQDSLRTMARFKLRSAFIMLGALVGVAAVTLAVSIGKGAERKILETMRQLFGASSIMVLSGGSLMSGPRGDASRLTLDDAEALAEELPGIDVWDPQQVLANAPVRHGDANGTARVLGQSERFGQVWNRGVTRGELFDAADVTASARVALIGETVVQKLFGGENPIGAEILIESVPFQVIGVLERLGTDLHGMDRDDEVVVPISTAMRRLLNEDTIRGIRLLVKDPKQSDAISREISRILRERHAIAAGQPDDFMTISPVFVQNMVNRVQRVFTLYLPLIAGIALLVGGAVSASLMLASVNQRVGEIGLRRAVGARPEDIRLQFVLETVLTMTSGGLLGILLGYAVARYASARWHLGEIFSWEAVLLGIALAAATGLLAGILPARRAAKLQPADALR